MAFYGNNSEVTEFEITNKKISFTPYVVINKMIM